MKRIAMVSALATLTACGPASPEPTRPTAQASASAAPTVTATASAAVAVPPDPVIPAQEGAGERAYVIDGGALVEVVVGAGKSVTVVPEVEAGFCNVDHRANVVWFGKGGALYAFDLADRKVHAVVSAATTPRPTEFTIDWGNESLGGDNKETFDAGAILHMADSPSVTAVLGCTGKMGYKCYVAEPLPPAPTGPSNAQTPRPKLTSELQAEVDAAQKGIATMKIVDATYLATLVGRGAKASLWSPPPTPQRKPIGKKPSVDGYFCYANKPTCGDLLGIPGSTLWWVGTSDLREMEWHREMRDLWDGKSEEFVNIVDRKIVRSHKPAGMELGKLMQVEGVRVSTAGVLAVDGYVFDGETVHYAPKDEKAPEKNAACGFAGGGWRVPVRPLVPNPPNTF
ncbi:MAG: hypothetical protein U0414_07805 [Polyangiaceae bacterium]